MEQCGYICPNVGYGCVYLNAGCGCFYLKEASVLGIEGVPTGN